MGCDIHGGLEIKDLNGKWHKLEPIIQDLSDFNKPYTSELPLGRDYTLFSILEKDHPRNYDNVKSIAPERGLPKDTAWYDDLDDIDFWGHSYVTLDEIQKFANKHVLIQQHDHAAKWTIISPIIYLCGYLTYLCNMFEDQCFMHLVENDCDNNMLNKYNQWMNNSTNNIRLVFAFDN